MARTSRPYRARFAAIVPVALACAAVDVLSVRRELSHRPASADQYLEAALLWAAFALAALAPAAIGDALARRFARARERFDRPARVAMRFAAWTVLPVIAHARLDRYTSLGGDFSALGAVAPWLDALAAVALLIAACALLGRLLARARPLALAAGASITAIAAGLGLSFHEELAPVAPPAAGKPNVLLLVWDTARAQSFALYGYDRDTTPNLADFARDAVVFTNARSASNYTLTSHLSLLTGVHPSHHGARLVRQRFRPRETPSVAEHFRRAGYRTGAFVGTGVLAAQTGACSAFEVFDDQVDPSVCDTHAWALVHDVQSVAAALAPALRNHGRPHWFQDFQRPARAVLERARAWIESDDERPWFCMVNLYDVHWPYLPEASARERWVRDYAGPVDGYSRRGDRLPPGYRMQPADDAHLADLYDGEMWELDGAVEAFLATIDLERTAVLMTADHGEAFGEGGRHEHDDVLECQLRVPLIVRPAGGVERRVIDAPVSGVDVAPTLLALAGLAPSKKHTGRDLLGPLAQNRPILVEDRDHPDPLDVRLAFYEGHWKLVRLGVGDGVRYQLFDLRTDTQGLSDVAAEHPEIVDRLAKALDELRAKWNASDAFEPSNGGFGNIDALRGLGYAGDDERDGELPVGPKR
jgi:arylsulfatase